MFCGFKFIIVNDQQVVTGDISMCKCNSSSSDNIQTTLVKRQQMPLKPS